MTPEEMFEQIMASYGRLYRAKLVHYERESATTEAIGKWRLASAS